MAAAAAPDESREPYSEGVLDRGRAPVAPAKARHTTRRRAFCPFCGREQVDKLVSDVISAEGALCIGRCVAAWEVLAALRRCESESEPVAARRRTESETQGPRAPALSELLLGRWRAGDWTVAPEDLLRQL